MITIYSANETNFTINGLGVITPLSCMLNVTINGSWYVELEHPYDPEKKYEKITKDNIIKISDIPIVSEQSSAYQLFRVYDVTRTLTSIKAVAFPVAFEATYDAIIEELKTEKKTATATLEDVMAYLNERSVTKYTVTSDYSMVQARSKKGNWKNTNLIALISGGDDTSIVNHWGGEVAYDNYTIMVNGKLGSTSGNYDIRYGKNMAGLSVDVDMSSVATRLYPVSSDGVRLEWLPEGATVPVSYVQYGAELYPYIRSEFVQVESQLIDTSFAVNQVNSDTAIATHTAKTNITNKVKEVVQDMWDKISGGQTWKTKWYEPEWVQEVIGDITKTLQKEVLNDWINDTQTPRPKLNHPTFKNLVQTCIKDGTNWIKNAELLEFEWDNSTGDWQYTDGNRVKQSEYAYVDRRYCYFNASGNYEPWNDVDEMDWIQNKARNSKRKFGDNHRYYAHGTYVYTMNGNNQDGSTFCQYYLDSDGWWDGESETASEWTWHADGNKYWFGETGAGDNENKYAHDCWLYIYDTTSASPSKSLYYFDSDGYMDSTKTTLVNWGWHEKENRWYFGSETKSQRAVYIHDQWLLVNGVWRKFKSDGTLTPMDTLKDQLKNLLKAEIESVVVSEVDTQTVDLYAVLYQHLKEYCGQFFEDDEIHLPTETIKVDLVELSRKAGYENFIQFEKVHLGDTVQIHDYVHNFHITDERIVSIKYDCLRGYNTAVTISKPQKSISKIVAGGQTGKAETLEKGNSLIAGEGITISNGVIGIDFDSGDSFAGDHVLYDADVTSGTKLGDLYINGEAYPIYSNGGGGGSDVDVTAYYDAGHRIAKIDVDEDSTDIYAPIDISYGEPRPNGGRDREFYNQLKVVNGWDNIQYEYAPSMTGNYISGTYGEDGYSYYTGDLASVNDLYHINISQTVPAGLFTAENHSYIVTQGTNKHNVHGFLFDSDSDTDYTEYNTKFRQGLMIPEFFSYNGVHYATQNFKYVYVAVDQSDSVEKYRLVIVSNNPLQLYNMRASSGEDAGVHLLAQSLSTFVFILDRNWNMSSIMKVSERFIDAYGILTKDCFMIAEFYYRVIYSNAPIDAVERTSTMTYSECETDNFEMNYLLHSEANGSAYSQIKNIYVKKNDRWVMDDFASRSLVNTKLQGVLTTSTVYNNLPQSEKDDATKLYFLNDQGSATQEDAIDASRFNNRNESGMTINVDTINNALVYDYVSGNYIGALSDYPVEIPADAEKIKFKIVTGAQSYTTTDDRFKVCIGVKATYTPVSQMVIYPNDSDWLVKKVYATRNQTYIDELDLSSYNMPVYLYVCGHGWDVTFDDMAVVTTTISYEKKIMYRDIEFGGGAGGFAKTQLYDASSYASPISLSSSYNGFDFLMIETYNANDKKNLATILSVSDLSSGSYVGIDNYLLYTITNTRTLTFHDDFDDTNHSRYIKAIYGLSASTGGGGSSDNSVLDVEVDGVSQVTNRIAEIILSPFTGATTQANGAKGQVPAPMIADKDKYLKGDGTWDTPAGGATYTAGDNIQISAQNVISATDTTYNDFAGSTHGLVPAVGSGESSKYLRGDGTWAIPTDTTYTAGDNIQISNENVISATDTTYTAGDNVNISEQNVISATDTTYSDFDGGAHGLVPAPSSGDSGKYLKSDGSWDTPTDTTYTAGNNVDITNNVISATDTTYSDFSGSAHGLVPPVGSGESGFLKSDGTWATPTGGASALEDLTDVDITTPTEGQILKYDGSEWVNADSDTEIVTHLIEQGSSVWYKKYDDANTYVRLSSSSTIGEYWNFQSKSDFSSGDYHEEIVYKNAIPLSARRIRYKLEATNKNTNISDNYIVIGLKTTLDSTNYAYTSDTDFVYKESIFYDQETTIEGEIEIQPTAPLYLYVTTTGWTVNIYTLDVVEYSSGAPTLEELEDVNISNPSDGQVLSWDSQNNEWKNTNQSGGTTVVANPSGTATADLNKIQIGSDIYDIPSGGGGGGRTVTTLYTNTGTSAPNSIILSDAYTNYDELYIFGYRTNNTSYKATSIYMTDDININDKITVGDDAMYAWYTVTNATTLTNAGANMTISKIKGIKY